MGAAMVWPGGRLAPALVERVTGAGGKSLKGSVPWCELGSAPRLGTACSSRLSPAKNARLSQGDQMCPLFFPENSSSFPEGRNDVLAA